MKRHQKGAQRKKGSPGARMKAKEGGGRTDNGQEIPDRISGSDAQNDNNVGGAQTRTRAVASLGRRNKRGSDKIEVHQDRDRTPKRKRTPTDVNFFRKGDDGTRRRTGGGIVCRNEKVGGVRGVVNKSRTGNTNGETVGDSNDDDMIVTNTTTVNRNDDTDEENNDDGEIEEVDGGGQANDDLVGTCGDALRYQSTPVNRENGTDKEIDDRGVNTIADPVHRNAGALTNDGSNDNLNDSILGREEESVHGVELVSVTQRAQGIEDFKRMEEIMCKNHSDLKHMMSGLLSEMSSLRAQVDKVVMQNIVIPQRKGDGSNESHEEVLWRQLPHFKHIFCDATMRPVLAAAMMKFLDERITGVIGNEEDVAEGLSAMFFSILPSDQKDSMTKGGGPAASKLRKLVVMSSLYHAQKDTFKIFKGPLAVSSGHRRDMVAQSQPTSDHTDNTASSHVRIAHMSSLCIEKPTWLSPQFIVKEDIESARQRIECTRKGAISTSGRKGKKFKVGEGPTGRDIAVFACQQIYRTVTKALHDSRERAKTVFFEEIGFILVDWKEVNAKVDQLSLKVNWSTESAELEDRTPNIPQSVVDAERDNNADMKNNSAYKSVLNKTEYMSVFVEYDVLVRTTEKLGNGRQRDGSEMMRLRRSIHLVEIARRMMCAYVGLPNATEVHSLIRFHKHSLRCIVCVARLLKRLIKEKLDSAQLMTFTKSSVRRGTNFDLISLMPARSTAQRIIIKVVSGISMEMYDSMHMPENRGHTSSTESAVHMADGATAGTLLDEDEDVATL